MSGQLFCPRSIVVAPVLFRIRRAMAPHLSGSELDVVTKAVREGKTSSEILGLISRRWLPRRSGPSGRRVQQPLTERFAQ